ncbi:MAG: hypothetical protein ACI85O_001113 [Saprospiraceae bacterium]|jgi:uncharacterized protein (TIGR01777 family)
MPTVLIGGGTGLVGNRLSQLLREKKYEVRHLSRKGDLNAEFPAYKWDTENGIIEAEAMKDVDYVINLAGAGIADKRWTDARKKLIIDSRTQTTGLLRKYIELGEMKPKAFISASAVGYYGNQGDKLMHEDAKPGDGFLSKSVRLWEESVKLIEATDLRTVYIRIGIVMSTKGGAMPELMKTFPLGVGAYFGTGKGYYSWVHIDDVAKSFVYAIENEKMKGIYNSVAPNPSQVKPLVMKMKEAYGRPVLVMPAPEFGIKLAFGELSHTVLDSTRVSSQKIEKAGFEFEFPELLPALQDIMAREV